MALGRALSAAIVGVTATIVDVEANVGPGLPRIQIVGHCYFGIPRPHENRRGQLSTALAKNKGCGQPLASIHAQSRFAFRRRHVPGHSHRQLY